MNIHQLSIFLAFAVLMAGSVRAADDCRTVPAPGGGYMTECRSQAPPAPVYRAAPAPAPMPPAPAAPPPPNGWYPRMCVTSLGTCSVVFSNPPSVGDICLCADQSGAQVPGSVAGR